MMNKVNLALRGQNHVEKVEKIINREFSTTLRIVSRTLFKKFFLFVFMIECFDLLPKSFQKSKRDPLVGIPFYLPIILSDLTDYKR